MSQQSFPNPKPSLVNRTVSIWNFLTEPVSSLTTIEEQRQAQLLSILTLILSFLFTLVLIYTSGSYAIFLVLLVTSLLSYALSRTGYHRAGIYLFTYAVTLLGYLRIYLGQAESTEAAISTTIHISLVFSSVLLSKRGFAGLVALSTVAAFAAPLYSTIPNDPTVNVARAGGIVFSIGAILYGITIFRENLEKDRRMELSNSNRKLEEVKVDLEKRMAARALELQDYNLKVQGQLQRLQNINQISQEITSSTALKVNDLLNRIARETSEKLGYYHVGIFLLDNKREYAVLQATNSSGGQKMLANRHQLKVGGVGVVGYVSQSGRARIALDTGADAIYFNNPYLPETRSEISLPIKYANTVVGVFDVQSTQAAAFNDEDIAALMTIANQLAVILNSRDESAIQFKAAKSGQQPRPYMNTEIQAGYSYLPDGSITVNTSQEPSPLLGKVIASGETIVVPRSTQGSKPVLAVPVKFRDQVIGVIQIESAETNRNWTEDEINLVQSISDRAALALENARLFEDATRRAEQEETITRITAQIGSSNDFERIMQTTIQELGLALGASRSFIQIGTSTEASQKVSK